jgi:hypothetical protein
MPWVGFEPTIPGFKRAKTVIGYSHNSTLPKIKENNIKGGKNYNYTNTEFGHPWPRSTDHKRRKSTTLTLKLLLQTMTDIGCFSSDRWIVSTYARSSTRVSLKAQLTWKINLKPHHVPIYIYAFTKALYGPFNQNPHGERSAPRRSYLSHRLLSSLTEITFTWF